MGCDILVNEVLLGRDLTYHTERRRISEPTTRAWTLHYHETLRLSSPHPGVTVSVGPAPPTPSPLDLPLPPIEIDIEETGFKPVDQLFRVEYRGKAASRQRVSEEHLRDEPAGPTQWIGHLTVHQPERQIDLVWHRPGAEPQRTAVHWPRQDVVLDEPHPAADPVLIGALDALDWNHDAHSNQVPGHARGVRVLTQPTTATNESVDHSPQNP